jgi:hypothetical protein
VTIGHDVGVDLYGPAMAGGGGRVALAWTGAGADLGVAVGSPGSLGRAGKVRGARMGCEGPLVAVGARGHVTVAWQAARPSRRPAPCSLFAARRGPRTKRFGAPQLVSTPGALVRMPVLAVGPRGAAGASWTDGDSVQASIAPRGGHFGVPEEASSYEYPYDSAIAFDARDRATVFWAAGDGDDDTVLRAARRPARGRFGEPRTVATPPPGFRGFAFFGWQAAVDPSGAAIALWKTAAADQGQVIARTGGSLDALQVLAEDDAAADSHVAGPRLAVAPNGTALAAWVRYDRRSRIVQAAVRPPGGVFGPATSVSASAEGNLVPAVAIDDAGRGVVAWPSGNDVAAATLEPALGFGAPRTLSRPGVGPGLPAAAVDGAGHSVVGWETPRGVQAAVFSSEAP